MGVAIAGGAISASSLYWSKSLLSESLITSFVWGFAASSLALTFPCRVCSRSRSSSSARRWLSRVILSRRYALVEAICTMSGMRPNKPATNATASSGLMLESHRHDRR